MWVCASASVLFCLTRNLLNFRHSIHESLSLHGLLLGLFVFVRSFGCTHSFCERTKPFRWLAVHYPTKRKKGSTAFQFYKYFDYDEILMMLTKRRQGNQTFGTNEWPNTELIPVRSFVPWMLAEHSSKQFAWTSITELINTPPAKLSHSKFKLRRYASNLRAGHYPLSEWHDHRVYCSTARDPGSEKKGRKLDANKATCVERKCTRKVSHSTLVISWM